MKKSKANPKPYSLPEDEELSRVEEPVVRAPRINRLQAAVSDFSFKKFQKIADMVPFTLSEWANILHLSERTLQRYAKDNKNFEGIYVDRILQIERLIEQGLEVFNTAQAFYEWLKQPKQIMGEEVTFEYLNHSDGIYHISDQLGRIQHGVYA